MNFAQGLHGIAIIYLLINKAVRVAWPTALNAGQVSTAVLNKRPRKQSGSDAARSWGFPPLAIASREGSPFLKPSASARNSWIGACCPH
ncbi:hypothetical protein LYNGBM3L_67220 [Moorena producens 3L]|uniref:Uncharacterized protein n=1 Tax=Moorena producens 3L TaxID=489825 RepID=F4Y205_9CYAN|nr:hypothetical protein LYNGBM3L_67220 [Moorena producens 3L]OLT64224.1 hypothetical protein BI334_03555 [Moorena producens 3L]